VIVALEIVHALTLSFSGLLDIFGLLSGVDCSVVHRFYALDESIDVFGCLQGLVVRSYERFTIFG